MPLIALRITEPQNKEINREIKKTGLNRSELIRRMIDSYLSAKPMREISRIPTTVNNYVKGD